MIIFSISNRFNLEQITKNWQKDQFGIKELLPAYNGSTLEIAGSKSIFVNEADFSLILERFPNAEFILIPDAAHGLAFSHKTQFISGVSRFIEDDFPKNDILSLTTQLSV